MKIFAARFMLGFVLVASVSTSVLGETAQYRAVFDVVWARETHPSDPIRFPDRPHFSGPIGATHSDRVVFWEPGMLATQGIQDMAEKGSRPQLTAEIDAAISAGTAKSVVAFCCTLDSPGSAQHEFTVDADFPLVSLVTMIAPSPDWFVGVSNTSLRDEDGWIGKQVIDLYAHDAGTDAGATFLGADAPMNSHEPIHRIMGPAFPDDVPLGTLTFLRLLDGDVSENGTVSAEDIDQLSDAIRNQATDTRFDLNHDRKVDEADRTYWIHEVMDTYVGDANLDGEFNSSDLVRVLVAAQYEDSIPGNSTWMTGDWDGDGEFTSRDLLVAFADGGYELGSQNRVVAVPEPTVGVALMFATFTCLCGIVRRRLRKS
ncbi:MAG: spondin domain-containing protein [Planctomycetales bacterium]|nr:spondin domain-containing protein [Planctomycetales bacterium]